MYKKGLQIFNWDFKFNLTSFLFFVVLTWFCYFYL